MPRVEVVFYRKNGGDVPLLAWLEKLTPKARIKCFAALELLEESGYELRRPVADYLRDGIYELRVHLHSINYRMLYFFHGRSVVVISHGLVKQQKVPPKEIDVAIACKQEFEADPKRHTFVPEP